MTAQQNGRSTGNAPAANQNDHQQYTAPTPDIRRASELFRQGFVFREDGKIVRHSKFAEILPGPDGWAVAIGIGCYRYESRVFWPWVMPDKEVRS